MSSQPVERLAEGVGRRAAPPRLRARDLLLLLLPCVPLAQVALSRRHTSAEQTTRDAARCDVGRSAGSLARSCLERRALSARDPSAGGERTGD
jgi:hypothetical protein